SIRGVARRRDRGVRMAHLPQHRVVTWAATAAVAVIGVQAWVGRMVVTEDLDADLVSVHLTISMIVVALITFVVVTTAPFPPNRASDPSGDTRDWTRLVAGGAAATLTVLLLDSYVHNLYISGWPLVGGRLVPSLTNRYVAVHFVHRLGAALVMALLVYLVAASLRRDRPRAEQLLVKGAASCFATNVALGAAHVFTEVSSSALVATHLLVAALVWTQLIAATTLAARGSAARGPDSWRSARASVG
ncbi:MAG: COX15/CtaA family protein, partial [Acidimicrobiales bacterium]